MVLAQKRPLIDRLLARPHDARALFAVYDEIGRDPAAYASLLVDAAGQTNESAAASHWLTEAARARHSLRDDAGAVRLLEAAMERDPLNLRAAEHLVELFRTHRDDKELANALRRRADWLKARYESEPVEIPRAVAAFEKLSGVYEALGDSEAALAALRRAFEFERARHPNTTPSPPEGPRESSLRSPSMQTEGAAPPPEPRWSVEALTESRDTLPSPLPAKEDSGPNSARGRSLPPDVPAGDPLFKMLEALRGLRNSDDVVRGANFVLATALEAIPALAGFVHICDEGTRDYVVVAASGSENPEILGTRVSEADPVVVRAHRETQAIVLTASELASTPGKRWSIVRPRDAVLCAPIQFDGRVLGAIELVDPFPSRAFRDADRHAMTYVAERFGEFLSDRSLSF